MIFVHGFVVPMVSFETIPGSCPTGFSIFGRPVGNDFHRISYYVRFTPRKLTWKPKNGGGWKMMFLFKAVIFRFQPLVFRGVSSSKGNLAVFRMVATYCRVIFLVVSEA